MPAQLDKVISNFRRAVRFSTPISATVLSGGSDRVLTVNTIWSQNNVERKLKMSSDMFQTYDTGSHEVVTHGSVETTGNLVASYSPSSIMRGVLREIPASGKSPKKQFIEIWKGNLMVQQFDLQSLDIHGDVYTDSDFSSFEWSSNEEQILYVAEKKQPKTESFLSRKPASGSEDKVIKGHEYLFSQDWGEQQVGKCKSVLAVADLVNNEVKLLNIKEDQEYFYASSVWAPGGGVIAVSYVIEPRRLGRVYCTNRPSYIVHVTPEGDLNKLSDEGKAVFGPKVSPDNSKLIWFERDVGGPHHSCVALVKYDWASKVKTTVVDVVLNEIKCTGGESFFGFYNHVQPSSCWLSDNKTVVLSTQQRASVKTYAVNTELNTITEIAGCADEEYSQGVLKVWKNYVICWRSSLRSLPGVYIAKIENEHLGSLIWSPLVPCKDIDEQYDLDILRLEGETWGDADVSVKNYSAIYFGPKCGEKAPLIIWSHGGPHSASSNVFSLMAYFFAKLGFAMLFTNYRGSIGAGKATVDYLLGRIAISDVSDVRIAQQYVLKTYHEKIDATSCLLYGGSYGGFLTLHLAGQFPDDYKCAVALNPAVDLTQFAPSDIPDWGYTEGGYDYSPLISLSADHYEKLKNRSPLNYVGKVKIPVLFLIGSKDLRVPPSHGINYYYSLKQVGKSKTKLFLYEDNHSLSQSDHETDFIINTACWFLESVDTTHT